MTLLYICCLLMLIAMVYWTVCVADDTAVYHQSVLPAVKLSQTDSNCQLVIMLSRSPYWQSHYLSASCACKDSWCWQQCPHSPTFSQRVSDTGVGAAVRHLVCGCGWMGPGVPSPNDHYCVLVNSQSWFDVQVKLEQEWKPSSTTNGECSHTFRVSSTLTGSWRAWWCGDLFLACEDFGRMFDNSFPACTFF